MLNHFLYSIENKSVLFLPSPKALDLSPHDLVQYMWTVENLLTVEYVYLFVVI